jgi:predicted nucleic acid-binding protein
VSTVIDASVLVAALIDIGSDGVWAEDVLSSGPAYAPELARVEAMNVLRRLERTKQISTPEANAAYEDLMQFEMETFPLDLFADRIWELRHNVTSYDAWYVAVAEALKLPLATLDRRLATVSGLACQFLMPPSP